jgi:erythromycin esterase-like protein
MTGILCLLLFAIASPVEEEDFLAWMKERAIRLDSLDWKKFDPSAFSVLDKALEGKRIVFLGEPDHFIHEKNDYRMILIRYLFEKGFCHVGMEMGLVDGRRIDRYLETGDAAHLDRVAIFGYKGDVRTDRDDTVPGFTDEKHPEFGKKVTAESRWFLEQLRSINASLSIGEERLHYFGYDVSMRPGGGYTDVEAMLSPVSDQPLAREIMKRAAPVPGESRIEESERLEGLLRYLANQVEWPSRPLGEEDAKELERILRGMAESFRFAEAVRKPRGSEERTEGMLRREQNMGRQAFEYIEDLPGDAKVILLGHNLHLSKQGEGIQAGEFKMWRSVGAHLAEEYRDQVFGIWMLFDHGRHGNVHLDDPVEELKSRPGTLERKMTHVGHLFLLPFLSSDHREAYLDQDRDLLIMGQVGRTKLRMQTDAVFFVAEVTPPAFR